MENKVNAKINKLIDLIYGETFTDTHRKVLLKKSVMPLLLLRKNVNPAGMKKISSSLPMPISFRQ